MHINNHKLIAECSAYDFKEALERKKTKSWLKTGSAFAYGDGGSLYYGIADDGTVVGLANPQDDAEFISETIKARIDPVPVASCRRNPVIADVFAQLDFMEKLKESGIIERIGATKNGYWKVLQPTPNSKKQKS